MPPNLQPARNQALALFQTVGQNGWLQPGVLESTLNEQIRQLAAEQFGLTKHWHKRIVRSGPNACHPYKDNPPDRLLEPNDLVYIDFGPVFSGSEGELEADLGRTYLLSPQTDSEKRRLLEDLEALWQAGQTHYSQNPHMPGCNMYAWLQAEAEQRGWLLGDWHCGHILGAFPHDKLQGTGDTYYMCPQNPQPLSAPDEYGNPRQWVLEVHLVSPDKTFGGFYEDLLCSV